MKTEHVEYTSLGVAVFEGWLDKGESSSDGDDEGLRWRVPLMREPIEFPMSLSAVRTVLDEPPPAAAAASAGEKATSDTNESSKEEGTAEPENKPDESEKEEESKSKSKESSSSSS